ncbi:nucleoside deaminase [bacterium]|nr:nucleoside deaminase [bacterium]
MIMEFMKFAIDEARKAVGDIPVGAVIVKDGEVVASAFNTKEKDNDVTSHAEILAIRQAEQVMANWRLDDCDMYVTLEPCPMCGWAILQSRIKNLYFGSYDNNYGAFSSKIDLRKIASTKLNVYGGILEDECNEILKAFFNQIRE